MKNDKASRTADFTAAIRAKHLIHDDQLIFKDSLAVKLAGTALSMLVKRKFVNRIINSPKTPDLKGSESLVLYRADYIEKKLQQAIDEGCQQYVIIAAGMDSFAYRCDATKHPLKVFEVDHPATQQVKRARLRKNKIIANTEVEYIGADLSKVSLENALKNSSYNCELKTFFSCAGLTYYLEEKDAFDLFQSIANVSANGSQVIFDYSDSSLKLTDLEKEKRGKMRAVLDKSGEKIRSNFIEANLATKMSQMGYKRSEDVGPKEIHDLYFANRHSDGLRASPHNRIGFFELCS